MNSFNFQKIKQPTMPVVLKSGKQLFLLTPSLSTLEDLQDILETQEAGQSGTLNAGVADIFRQLLSCNKAKTKITKGDIADYTLYEFLEFLQAPGGYMDFLTNAVNRPE